MEDVCTRRAYNYGRSVYKEGLITTVRLSIISSCMAAAQIFVCDQTMEIMGVP